MIVSGVVSPDTGGLTVGRELTVYAYDPLVCIICSLYTGIFACVHALWCVLLNGAYPRSTSTATSASY